jgi:hypothetical protein
LALGWTTTVPAHSFCAPTRAWEIASARVIPAVCGVFVSSSPLLMTRMPCRHQSGQSFASESFIGLTFDSASILTAGIRFGQINAVPAYESFVPCIKEAYYGSCNRPSCKFILPFDSIRRTSLGFEGEPKLA